MASTEVALGQFFHAVGGSAKFIRDYLTAHPGPFPVYSASIIRPFGAVDEYEYEGRYLTWVMNGYGGRMQEVEGKFSVNRDRGVLIPRAGIDIPDLTYLRYVVEPRLMECAVGRRVDGGKNEYTKIYPEAAEAVTFSLPTTPSGLLDLDRMAAMGERIRRVLAAQSLVTLAREPLARAVFPLEIPEPSISVLLGDALYFELSIGKRVLRGEHQAEGIPVYSANAIHPFGFVEKSNLSGFDRPSLLWGIDGVFDWNLIPSGTVFATTDHCGRLQSHNENVDLEYVYWYLRSTRERYGFDRVFRASLTNVKAEISVVFPTDSRGTPCIDKQRVLAEAMRRRERARSVSLASIDDVMRSRLMIEDS